MDEQRPSYGKRLAAERERLGYTQRNFAELLGVSVTRQSLMETGARELRAGYLVSLHAAAADVHYVLTGKRQSQSLVGSTDFQFIEAYLALPSEVQSSLSETIKDLAGQTSKRGKARARKT